MATPSKTVDQVLLGLQTLAAGAVVASGEQDVATKLAAWISIRHGRTVTNALALPVRYRVEGRSRASGTGYWTPLAEWQTGIATAETETLQNNESAGATVLEVASTTNLNIHDVLFFKNGTLANSEWQRIAAKTTNVSITIEEGLRNGQNVSPVYTMAEIFEAHIDLTGIAKLRLVASGAACDQDTVVEALMNTLDSFA